MVKQKISVLMLALALGFLVGCASNGGGSRLATGTSEADQLLVCGYSAIVDKNYSAAEDFLSKGLALAPINPFLLNNLGTVYQRTGRPAQARPLYEKIIALYGKDTSEATRAAATTAKRNPSNAFVLDKNTRWRIADVAQANLDALK
jgi:tetratricopeptide (TPR) repeat protein